MGFGSMDGTLMLWNFRYEGFDLVADITSEVEGVVEIGVVIDRDFYVLRCITHDYADFMHLIHAHIYHNRDEEELLISNGLSRLSTQYWFK